MNVRLSSKRTDGANLGKYEKFVDPGLFRLILLMPYGWICELNCYDTPEQVNAKILASLIESLKNDDPAFRAQIIGPIEGMEDKSTERGKGTYAYGREVYTSKEIIKFDVQYAEGGLDYHNKVRKYDGCVRERKVVIIDQKGNVYTKVYNDADTPAGLEPFAGCTGIPMSEFATMKWKPMAKDTPPKYGVSVTLKDSDDWDDNLLVIATEMDMESELEPYQVQDVQLLLNGDDTSDILIVPMLGGINMVDILDLTDPTAWKVYNKETGNAIDITSITKVVEGRLRFVLDETDPDYVVNRMAVIELAAISDLEDLSLKYYASNKLSFKML